MIYSHIHDIHEGIFATTEAGEILQRLADRNGVLVWVDISLPQDHLAHGSVGVRSPHGEVWVLSQSYVIFYRILEHQRWVPRYSRGVSAIGLLLDLEHLEHHQAFGISWPERKLVRASIESKDLVWHTIELPRGVAHLNLTPGARCTNGIFLQGETDNGDNVLLFYFNDRLKDRPKWRFYIVPEIKPGKALGAYIHLGFRYGFIFRYIQILIYSDIFITIQIFIHIHNNSDIFRYIQIFIFNDSFYIFTYSQHTFTK